MSAENRENFFSLKTAGGLDLDFALPELMEHIVTKGLVTEEAFYVVDLNQVTAKFNQWHHYLPRVQPHYAVKCCPDDEMIKTLYNCGAGFDCASLNEIKQVLNHGIEPSSIIFANPCKQKSHIEYAKSVGVSCMTFDNLDELDKIKELFPEARVVLRILTDDSKSLCRFGTKFGAHPRSIPYLLLKVKHLGLHLEGVSFHVGSSCLDPLAFSHAVRQARRVFNAAVALGLPPLTLLDIGGGFPGTDDGQPNFHEVAVPLAKTIDELFPEGCGVRVISEPGRFFACTSHHLAVNIYAHRNPRARDMMAVTVSVEEAECLALAAHEVAADITNFEEECQTPLFYVNDGVYGAFNCTVFDHADPQPNLLFPPRPVAKTKQLSESCSTTVSDCDSDEGDNTSFSAFPTVRATLFGPTCDSIDVCSKNTLLPASLARGDWLYYTNMGAYTAAAATHFNGMAPPKLFYVSR
eukprot:GCRY01000490.1.p1 GENE.GCRY01000490.1~~GCRY01000490.1.p1  ORF type:complete len:465 (+),score=129.62 GCRY01000490.1:245-1639(+)